MHNLLYLKQVSREVFGQKSEAVLSRGAKRCFVAVPVVEQLKLKVKQDVARSSSGQCGPFCKSGYDAACSISFI